MQLEDIDVFAATAGPGLIGALLVGFTFAKGLSFALQKPFIAVNHIEGHIFSGFLMPEKPEFPFLCLVVSGGHTLLLLVNSFSDIKLLGNTLDDAAGEAFDKVSKMLGLGYPGGPKIQKAAESGNSHKIPFPIADLKEPFDFSFSGLKTAVLRHIQKYYGKKSIPADEISDIAASFQNAAVAALIKSMDRALNKYDVKSISVVGGVAANKLLRDRTTKLAKKFNKKIIIPDLQFCGDNAAMIAFRGKTLFEAGTITPLNAKPFPSLQNSDYRFYRVQS